MLTSDSFGAFLKEKRIEKGYSLRELSNKAGIAHTYLLKIEKGEKPPPSDNVLLRLSKALSLGSEDSIEFFDLAATSKTNSDSKNIYLPADISEYLFNTNYAQWFIREIKKHNLSNEFWKKLLKSLK